MEDKVDPAAYSLSAEYRDRLLVLFVFGILPLPSPITLALLIMLNYKIYMPKKISPVVHSSSAWYGYGSNTARRIALGIAALTLLLLVLAVHSLGVEYSNILNTAILIAVGIVGFLLSFEIIPFIARLNYKTNMSSEISPVVYSSMIGFSNNKPPQRGGKRYSMQIPLEYSEFSSRRPRPRMIVRA